jgi:hypothetical protein
MLEEVEDSQESSVIAFLPHGRAFMINDVDAFVKNVLPRYLAPPHTWHSFVKQLAVFGFRRVMSGADFGAYYHCMFVRGTPSLFVTLLLPPKRGSAPMLSSLAAAAL